MTAPQDLLRIQQSLRESRISISREYNCLLADLDFQSRFKDSVRHHPIRWISGAAVTGLLATLFAGSKRSRKRVARETVIPISPESGVLSKTSWLLGIIEIGKLFYPILRPVFIEFVSNTTQAILAKSKRRHD